MSISYMPSVGNALARLQAQIADRRSDERVWTLIGSPGTGKTTVLRALEQWAKDSGDAGLTPILVSPPARMMDSGPIAFAQVARGMQRHGIIDGRFGELMREGMAWSEKIQRLERELANHADRLLLLIDEPDRWEFRPPGDTPHFASRSAELSQLLASMSTCRRVIAGKRPQARGHSTLVSLWPSSRAEAMLSDAPLWGRLAPNARQVWDSYGRSLDSHTALDLRLVVAMRAVVPTASYSPDSKTSELAGELFACLHGSDDYRSLCDTWARLALFRGPFDRAWASRCGAEADDSPALEVLGRCLLGSADGQSWLHEALRAIPWGAASKLSGRDSWLGNEAERDLHGRMAEYYTARFRQTDGAERSGDALLDEMEAFYHATQACREDLTGQLRVFFSDQLNMLGKALSLARKYGSAARVFARSLEWDHNDDYAHHYLAFNLDVDGRDPERVEEHYRRAVELSSSSVWWWSRWICFLITLGRTREARVEWDRAEEELGLRDSSAEPSVYFHLHSWAARLLLHRGQLDFAERVLNDIPERALAEDVGQVMTAMKRRLRQLLEARRHNAVFPTTVDPQTCWDGPHLSSRQIGAGKKLTEWLPGRIEEIGEDSVYLAVARRPEANGEPVHGNMTLSRKQFDQWSLDEHIAELRPGRFVEIAFYGQNRAGVVIRVHADRPFTDLPPVFPNPARYLRVEGQRA